MMGWGYYMLWCARKCLAETAGHSMFTEQIGQGRILYLMSPREACRRRGASYLTGLAILVALVQLVESAPAIPISGASPGRRPPAPPPPPIMVGSGARTILGCLTTLQRHSQCLEGRSRIHPSWSERSSVRQVDMRCLTDVLQESSVYSLRDIVCDTEMPFTRLGRDTRGTFTSRGISATYAYYGSELDTVRDTRKVYP